jgi:hypothetical protein
MKRGICLFFLIVFGLAIPVFAQNPSSGPISVSILKMHGSYQFSAADFANRFGDHVNIGFEFGRKTKSNWWFGISAQYLFGNQVRDLSIFDGFTNGSGVVFTETGVQADMSLRLRGLAATATIGKVFPIIGPNKNCGLLVKLGLGYLEHKIYVNNTGFYANILTDDYLKGFDRLSGGFYMQQFVGYLHLSDKKLINYYFGLEISEGFTSSIRKFNYTTGLPDNGQYFDMMIGIKAGWMLPFFKRADKEVMTF